MSKKCALCKTVRVLNTKYAKQNTNNRNQIFIFVLHFYYYYYYYFIIIIIILLLLLLFYFLLFYVPPCLSEQFHVLTKCTNKFDCLIKEMLFIRKLKPSLNVQTDSIRAKVFT